MAVAAYPPLGQLLPTLPCPARVLKVRELCTTFIQTKGIDEGGDSLTGEVHKLPDHAMMIGHFGKSTAVGQEYMVR